MPDRITTYRIFLSLWVAVLVLFSFYTPQWFSFSGSFQDKWKHLLGSFILALLFHKAYPSIYLRKAFLYWIIFSFLGEVAQDLITGGRREFDSWDILFNLIGFAVGCLTYSIKIPKHRSNLH